MKKAIYLILYVAVAVMTASCSDGAAGRRGVRAANDGQPAVERQAMELYDYQPGAALRLIESAEAEGRVSPERGGMLRMKVYCWTCKAAEMDSLLGGPEGVRFDSARALGERLLETDTMKENLMLRQQVLEQLVYTARHQADKTLHLTRAQELIDVCHERKAETEALRTEAEVGAALYAMGRRDEGLARMDSAIALLDNGHRSFNRLDATIIALKRKLNVLGDDGRHMEALPLMRRIIDRLDDYEQHPEAYHDGSYREPTTAEERTDYINFYRTQAEKFIARAYAELDQTENADEAYEKLELAVSDATAREHVARYRALEHRAEAELQQGRAERRLIYLVGISLVAALLTGFSIYLYRQKQVITEKNLALVRQMDETTRYRKKAEEQQEPATPEEEPHEPDAEELFRWMSGVIEREKLYLDARFDRQAAMDRFHLSKERIGAAFAQGGGHPSLSAYVRNLRLDYSLDLLTGEPDMTIEQVAQNSGFASNKYYGSSFKARYGMTPSEYRLLNTKSV